MLRWTATKTQRPGVPHRSGSATSPTPGVAFLCSAAWPWLNTPEGAARDGNHHPSVAPQNLYETRDGLLAIEVETQLQLNAVTDLLDLVSCDLEQSKGREIEFDTALSKWAAKLSTNEAESDCIARGIPAGRVQSMADIAENPHTWLRDMLLELEHPISGPLKLLGSPFISSRHLGVVAHCAPSIGQDTAAVLTELLGYDNETLLALAADGVIGLCND